MRICLFEDGHVADLEPLTLTRPAFELRCGLTTLAQKQLRYFGATAAGALVRSELASFYSIQQDTTPVNEFGWLTEEPVILVNGRWLPPSQTVIHDRILREGPCVGLVDEQVAFALLNPEHLRGIIPERIDEFLANWRRTLPGHRAEGRLVRYLWELVDLNGEEIAADFDAVRPADLAGRPDTLTLIGASDWLHIDPTARIDPFVVADTSNGPVVIDRDAVVTSFTRLEGPCHVGPRTQVFRANIRGGTTIGPNCRVGGEIESSILLGNVNKYHDGFVGHSYLGEWVNLGAGSHVSDLRNDYGKIRMTVNGARIATGVSKIGAFVGDHTKIGLGVLLNTGSNIGVFCRVLPSGGLLPTHAPSFCQVVDGRLCDVTRPEALFGTAEIVMSRRGDEFTTGHEAFFSWLHESTASSRRNAICEAENRRSRRAA